MTRAILGSFVGSAFTLFLFVNGPQAFQQGIALISDDGLPETLIASVILAYVAGFILNSERPKRWLAVAAWLGGWLGGFMALFLFNYTFNRAVPV